MCVFFFFTYVVYFIVQRLLRGHCKPSVSLVDPASLLHLTCIFTLTGGLRP